MTSARVGLESIDVWQQDGSLTLALANREAGKGVDCSLEPSTEASKRVIPRTRPQERVADSPERLDGFRIVVAEPDHELLEEYRRSLAAGGFQVLTASNGVECTARLRAEEPNLLVLNPALLWGGGEGVLALMQDERVLPSIPVLLLYDESDYRAFVNLRAFAITVRLRKPASGWLLLNCVQLLLTDLPTKPSQVLTRP